MLARVHHGLHLTSRLTHRRLGNLSALTASYLASRAGISRQVWGMPASISFEPTTSCNLRCPECPSGLRSFTRPRGMAQEETLQTLLRQTSADAGYLNLYFQGEPYLNPSFLDMATEGAGHGMYVSTSTNAHYLTEENCLKTIQSGLSRLIVSLDGTTQETYQAYRVGGKLKTVLEGVRRLVAMRRRLKAGPYIVIQFLVVGPNEHQIEEARKLTRSLGADEIVFKTAQIYDYAHGSPLIPQQNGYSRYRKLPGGDYAPKNNFENHCWKMWHSCVVTWDGKVVPCCFDKDAEHQMGDMSTATFAEIWQNPDYKKFRLAIARSRKEVDMCTNCSEGGKVFV